MLVNLLQCTGQPHSKSYLAPNTNSSEIEKHWPGHTNAAGVCVCVPCWYTSRIDPYLNSKRPLNPT